MSEPGSEIFDGGSELVRKGVQRFKEGFEEVNERQYVFRRHFPDYRVWVETYCDLATWPVVQVMNLWNNMDRESEIDRNRDPDAKIQLVTGNDFGKIPGDIKSSMEELTYIIEKRLKKRRGNIHDVVGDLQDVDLAKV